MLGVKDPKRYTVYVRSYKPGKEIAKMLLIKINEIFQELARTKKVVISHVVTFISEESEMKIKKYYVQLGYTKEDFARKMSIMQSPLRDFEIVVILA